MSLANRGIVRAAIVAVAVLLVLHWWRLEEASWEVPSAMAQEEVVAPSARLVLSFPFYGSTPILSWSPDGQRLAFNAAYEYFGYDGEEGAFAGQLGLWVYERDTETTRHLLDEQRYHPAWIGNQQIASACSPYENCTEGLYLTELDGTNRLALEASVYHTVAASSSDHEVLFFNGFSGYTEWNKFDTDTSTRSPNLSSNCSWEPPPELFQDQCVQQVGEVSVAADASSGLWVRYGESDPIQVDATPAYEFSSSAWDCAGSHGGPVAPCLSPDGSQVAYVGASFGSLVLRVHELPTAEDVASVIGAGAGSAAALPLFDPAGPVQAVIAPTADPPAPMASRETPTTSSDPSRAYLAFDFFGDTPSLAWSPDSAHLAFNAAFVGSAYMADYDPAYAAVSGNLGLFVVDAAAGSIRRIVNEQRYHPAWLQADQLVSACSMFEGCTAGLAMTKLDGETTVAAVGSGTSHTAAGTDGRALFFDYDHYTWSAYDVATGETTREISSNCSWEPPAELSQDQCLQQVGDTRVWAQVPTGLYVQIGDAPAMRLDPSPPWLYEFGYAWGCSREDFSGPIAPCLSPDGRRVAYVTRSATGLSMHLHEIPSAP